MKFSRNTKYYSGVVYEWNLPAGHTCPFAKDCKISVDRITGKFKKECDGFACYAGRCERYPAVRESRWRNYEYVKNGGEIIIPEKAEHIRIHGSGDFFSQKYFDTWIDICKKNSGVKFWAFTKSVRYWVKRDIPSNLILTASYGGFDDDLISQYGLKSAVVVKSESDTKLPIDTNDDLARVPDISFALVDNNKRGAVQNRRETGK